MSVTFGFYNSRNGDRVYDATQMSSLFNGIIRDGVFANYPAQNQHLTIAAGPAVDGHPTVEIGPGRAWFNGTWTDNSSALSLKLPAADNSQDRYDAIILEVNTTNDADNASNLYPSTWDGGDNGRSIPGRSNAFAVLAGTPGGNYPTVSSSDGIYRYALAYVKVAHGASTVSSLDYKVGTTVPYIVNAVQETWDATDLINNWNSQWTAYLNSLNGQFSTYLSGKDSAWNTYLDGKDDAWAAFLAALNADIPGEIDSALEEKMSKFGRIWLVDKDISSVVDAMQTFARDAAVYPVPTNAPNFYPDFFTNVADLGDYPPRAKDVVIGKNGYYGIVTAFTGSAENYSMMVKSVGQKIWDVQIPQPVDYSPFIVTFSGVNPEDSASSDNPTCDRTATQIRDAYLAGKNIIFRCVVVYNQVQSGSASFSRSYYSYPLSSNILEIVQEHVDDAVPTLDIFCAFKFDSYFFQQLDPDREIVWFRFGPNGLSGGAESVSSYFDE